MIDRRHWMNVCDVRSMRGPEILSSHYLVRPKIRLKIKRIVKIKSEIKKWDTGNLNKKDIKEEIIKDVTTNVQNTELEEVEDIN
jgi:hypothetical protein